MAPPLERKDLFDKRWRFRSLPWFRFPRRKRRVTALFWALILAVFYYILCQSQLSDSDFEAEEPTISVRFPKLYATLSRVVGGSSSSKWNRNVIFVAANLMAASKMAGLACEMAEHRKSNVHFALMGFDNIAMDDFRRLNGIPQNGEEGCYIQFHDARPDHTAELPLSRRKLALRGAFRHINDFMHPQAMIMFSAREDPWFTEIAKEKAKQMKLTLIDLPEHNLDDLKWMARLDSGSLHAWHVPSFEITIHADTHTGNLKRLLKSLESAHYPSLEHRPKHITIIIEPSVSISTFLKKFLEGYEFPDRHKISIRRPLYPKQDSEATALNFIQSFYSLNENHAVLFLDPNMELSKWYSHYILFATLAYRHASYPAFDTVPLLGISLESPASYLSGETPFVPTDVPKGSPFLHPAPTSRAILFFSQHWSEYYSFVSHKLYPHPNLGPRNTSHQAPAIEYSDKLPVWQYPLIELIRARGYVILYPSFDQTLALFHEEIPSQTQPIIGKEKKVMNSRFLEALPDGKFPGWDELPLLSIAGQQISTIDFDEAAMNFHLSITTCRLSTSNQMLGKQFEVDDLFCDTDGNSV